MNSKLTALVMRSLLVCTPGFVCQCSSPGVPVPTKMAEPVLFRESTLMERVRNLERGDSMERCVSILGEPTMRQVVKSKAVPRQLLSTNFYYAVRQDGRYLDQGTDRYLQVRFDAAGGMEWEIWYGQP